MFVNSTDTLVVGTSTGRTYLEIQNASGATTTPQVVSCNFGDRPATLYSGFQLFSSRAGMPGEPLGVSEMISKPPWTNLIVPRWPRITSSTG